MDPQIRTIRWIVFFFTMRILPTNRKKHTNTIDRKKKSACLEKKILLFGKINCVPCHVYRSKNEMYLKNIRTNPTLHMRSKLFCASGCCRRVCLWNCFL